MVIPEDELDIQGNEVQDNIDINNTWSGHETSVYDRADLVMDLPQLMAQSKSDEIHEWGAD